MSEPSLRDIYPFHQFTSDFAHWVKDGHDLRYCFVVGAGASRSSGIPTGASLVDEWLHTRFEQECPGCGRDGVQRWAEKTFEAWPDFRWSDRSAFYGRTYEWFYHDNATGQAALRKMMKGKTPSFGYSVLARIVSETEHKVVLTTNFDNLVRDALALYPNVDPFICHGETDARYLAGHSGRVRIVKLHGDIDRETYNASAQIEQLHPHWDAALRGIFTDHTPIFLGYGGNDPGFMRFLTDQLENGQFRARPIWAYRVDLDALSRTQPGLPVPPGLPGGERIRAFMGKHGGLWLPIPGFDELMLVLGYALGYENLAPRIRSDADSRARYYESRLAEAVKSVRTIPCQPWCPQLDHLARAAERALLGEEKRRTWDEWRVALEAVVCRREKATLFDQALKELSESAELKTAYAGFLAEGEPRDPQVDQLLKEATVLADKTGGPDSPVALSVSNQVAIVHLLRAEYAAAQQLAERVLAKRERALGPDHPDTLKSVNNLANILGAQGRYREAGTLHRRVLEGRERALGPDHPNTLKSVNNLANAVYLQGKYGEAEKLYRRALEGFERTLGADHTDTLTSLNNLAATLCSEGRYSEAEQSHRRALEGRERALGPDHPDTLTTINGLASTLYLQGRYAEAETWCRRALAGFEPALGPDHPETLKSVNNLADALYSQGRYPEAEPLYQRSLAVFEKTFGPDHPDVETVKGMLAKCRSMRGTPDRGETRRGRAGKPRPRG